MTLILAYLEIDAITMLCTKCHLQLQQNSLFSLSLIFHTIALHMRICVYEREAANKTYHIEGYWDFKHAFSTHIDCEWCSVSHLKQTI